MVSKIKSIIRSKTFWLAVATFLLSFLTGILEFISVQWALTLIAILMLLVRTFTTQAVEWKFW